MVRNGGGGGGDAGRKSKMWREAVCTFVIAETTQGYYLKLHAFTNILGTLELRAVFLKLKIRDTLNKFEGSAAPLSEFVLNNTHSLRVREPLEIIYFLR